MSHLIQYLLQMPSGDWGDIRNGFKQDIFCTLIDFLYAMGGLVGLIGAVRIYQKWNNRHQFFEADLEVAGWIGSCVFLLIVPTMMQLMFRVGTC